MAFVYKYVDSADRAIYVGKVNGPAMDNLYSRHLAHMRDNWYKPNSPKCFYCFVPSPADADVLETILISVLCPPENISKTTWGESSFASVVDSLDWTELPDDPQISTIVKTDCPEFAENRCRVCGKQLMSNHATRASLDFYSQKFWLRFGGNLCKPCSRKAILCACLTFSYVFKEQFEKSVGYHAEQILDGFPEV